MASAGIEQVSISSRVAVAGAPMAAFAEAPVVLRRFAAERDWAGLEALYDRYWIALAAEYPEELAAAVSEMPVSVLHERPRLLFAALAARQALACRNGEQLYPYLRQYQDIGARLANEFDPASESSADNLVVFGSAVLTWLRLQGRFAEGESLGSRVSDRLAELSPVRGVEPVPRPGWLALQRALTRTMSGDFPGAAEQYRVAHEQARTEDVAFYAGARAAANLAMLFAQLGHHGAVHHWLGQLRSYPPLGPGTRFIVGEGGRIAEGWQALDRYDRAAVDAVLDEIGDGTRQTELWPFVTALSVARALHFGDPVVALESLETIRLSHDPGVTRQGIAAQVLERARADLLLASGEANRALRVVEDGGAHAPHLLLPAARLRLLSGDYELARAIASRGAARTGSSRRDARQLLLLKAVATSRMGDRDGAVRAATSAMRVRPGDEVLSLASLSPEDRETVLGLVPNALTAEAAGRLAEARPVLPGRVHLVELTARERAVLTELAKGGSVPDIALRLVVSVNTVRTQTQSVYRKLGVSSRGEAVMRASELGLL